MLSKSYNDIFMDICGYLSILSSQIKLEDKIPTVINSYQIRKLVDKNKSVTQKGVVLLVSLN